MPDSKTEKSGLWWLWLSLIVFILDQFTKYIASESLVLYEPEVINGILNWTLMHNRGMAFSLLADQPGWQRWGIGIMAIIIVVVLLFWLRKNLFHDKLVNISLVMLIGGALGNIYDRFALGYVIDFIEVHYNQYYWPAFNIADTAISIGVFLLIIDLIINKNEDKPGKS